MQILETMTNHTDQPGFRYNMKNNSINGYVSYTDFRDYVENSFITNYAD